MPLTHLEIAGNTKVEDLSALKGMPAEISGIQRCESEGPGAPRGHAGGMDEYVDRVLGIRPHAAQGYALEVPELRRMEGQKLDLAPLAGMPLECLHIDHTKVSDLAPIKHLPLNELNIWDTSVADLSPLKDLPLKKIVG